MEREQIIKALECCGEYNHGTTCKNCPYMYIELADNEICSNRMAQDALSLIKKLTEENERLHASCTELTQNLHECKADTVRKMHSELYEEFLKVARCQKSGEPNMTSQEVLAILKRKSKEMEEENV